MLFQFVVQFDIKVQSSIIAVDPVVDIANFQIWDFFNLMSRLGKHCCYIRFVFQSRRQIAFVISVRAAANEKLIHVGNLAQRLAKIYALSFLNVNIVHLLMVIAMFFRFSFTVDAIFVSFGSVYRYHGNNFPVFNELIFDLVGGQAVKKQHAGFRLQRRVVFHFLKSDVSFCLRRQTVFQT